MLNPKKDRIDFGEQLIPPEGYELDFAVCTTYSLDLQTLLLLPVALYNSQLLDNSLDELYILESIAQTSKKICVFCQKGKISVPHKYNYLMAYWEKSVFQITLNHYAQSFHPKVWVIKYHHDRYKPIYRLLITSRNLTFASDWDVAFTTEGLVSDRTVSKNIPLITFLKYLELKTKQKFPKHFLKELEYAEFDIPDNFHLMDFHPIGIKKSNSSGDYKNPLMNKTWDELLAISPFIDNKTLKKVINSSSKKIFLLSTREELDRLNSELLESTKPFQFSTFIENAEYSTEISEDNDIPNSQGLHSKFFIGKRSKYFFWYLGSANLTDPAFGRNIEFMVELKSEVPVNAPYRIFKELTSPDDRNIVIFQSYNSEFKSENTDAINIELDLRKLIFIISKIKITANAIKINNSNFYNIILRLKSTKQLSKFKYDIKLKLLSLDTKAQNISNNNESDEEIVFSNIIETQLTPFIQWEIHKDGELLKQFLTKIDITLPESRLGKIINLIINSQDKFFKYIAYLLLNDQTGYSVYQDDIINKEFSIDSKVISYWSIPGMPIFENLMIAASRSPKKLKSIDELINKLKENSTEQTKKIITKEFESFWNMFKELSSFEKG
ncbi:MAG: phospholipase D family protein [Candidatus Thorarchaeota archaeon]